LIALEAHDCGTASEIFNGSPSIRPAGVATHAESFVLHVPKPAQQTLIKNIYQNDLVEKKKTYFKSIFISQFNTR
jgi:hypothetical protein